MGGFAAFAVGTGVAYWMYIMKRGAPAKRLAQAWPGLYRLVMDKWRIDELYDNTALAMVDALADTVRRVRQRRSSTASSPGHSALIVERRSGRILRAFQTGVVHVYAAFMVLGLVAFGWFFVAPHARTSIDASAASDSGDYVVNAGPGMGYQYRWDTNGDGKPDAQHIRRSGQQVKIHLDAGKTQKVGRRSGQRLPASTA